jgi:hypothetical protein
MMLARHWLPGQTSQWLKREDDKSKMKGGNKRTEMIRKLMGLKKHVNYVKTFQKFICKALLYLVQFS